MTIPHDPREVYDRYGPALVRKAERVLQSREEAEDVVHALFVDFLERGEAPGDLPYLYRAVTNRCLNVLRDRGNRQRLLAPHDEALRGPARTRLDEHAIGLDLLAKLVDRLDAKHQEVLVYRYFDDLGQEEIAELLDTSRKTVGKRLDRIRDAVRALLPAGQGGVA